MTLLWSFWQLSTGGVGGETTIKVAHKAPGAERRALFCGGAPETKALIVGSLKNAER